MLWDMWKKGFEAWEGATARATEQVLKNPLLLGPTGLVLNGMMKAKAAHERATSAYLGALGFATKHDQEKTLQALNQIQSRLLDLEERLAKPVE